MTLPARDFYLYVPWKKTQFRSTRESVELLCQSGTTPPFRRDAVPPGTIEPNRGVLTVLESHYRLPFLHEFDLSLHERLLSESSGSLRVSWPPAACIDFTRE
jgi:hypothetical protein